MSWELLSMPSVWKAKLGLDKGIKFRSTYKDRGQVWSSWRCNCIRKQIGEHLEFYMVLIDLHPFFLSFNIQSPQLFCSFGSATALQGILCFIDQSERQSTTFTRAQTCTGYAMCETIKESKPCHYNRSWMEYIEVGGIWVMHTWLAFLPQVWPWDIA